MAGGRLIALNKNKEDSPPDIRPIVVGESLRRLAGKCICASLKEKTSEFFFQPLQFGMACRAGAEKIVHSLRNCIEEHWMQEADFVVFKVDMTNSFNLVSRQAVLDECSAFSPKILPWVSWCNGSHPELWLPVGHLSSQSGVQQGDPLGPMLFALVLQKLISTIDADDECLQLLLQAWYLDDGVLAAKNCSKAKVLFTALVEVAEADLHVAVSLLRICGFGRASNRHLLSAISKFNALVSPTEAIAVESVLSSPLSQHALCKKLDDHLFQSILMTSSPANKCHANMVGMLSSDSIACETSLLSFVTVLTYLAKPAAFDVTVTSPLTPATLHDAGNSTGVAAHKAECRKHSSNDPKCQELGWVCVPLAVESYGNWGKAPSLDKLPSSRSPCTALRQRT
ncbi:hypothetical protein EMCRGX_G011154 [Ephydatia muelleri]